MGRCPQQRGAKKKNAKNVFGCLRVCVWVSESLGLRVSGSLGLWFSGSLGFRGSGALVVWVSGGLGLWGLAFCVSGSLCLFVSSSLCLCVVGSLFLCVCLYLCACPSLCVSVCLHMRVRHGCCFPGAVIPKAARSGAPAASTWMCCMPNAFLVPCFRSCVYPHMLALKKPRFASKIRLRLASLGSQLDHSSLWREGQWEG